MIETLEARPGSEVDDLGPAALVASIRSARTAEDAAAARQLDLAGRWADLHPPESIHSAATFTSGRGIGLEVEEPIAGEGCPMVAEFCVAELGTVLGISTVSAKRLIGHALELRHRLPRLWTHVQSGRVPAWRARSVAEATIHATPSLTVEAASWVDVQVAAVAGKVGPAQLDRLVAEAIKRYELQSLDPTADPEDGYLSVDPRHATLHDQDVHFAGTMRLEAELDLADALDLDRVLVHGAATRAALGSTESLDVRRSKTLGDLARTQTALDLHGHTTPRECSDGDRVGDGLPVAREVVLHAHFTATTQNNGDGDGQTVTVFGRTGRLEERQRLVLLDHVRSWCGDSRTKVTVKPVIDLNTDLSSPGYRIPDRIREQVILRDQTCVFPWCTRPARDCDVDHVLEHDHHADTEGRPQPGPTQSDNLAALCRFHHRLKTHTAWHYQTTGPGEYVWTSPHGHRYHRDPTGTTALDPPPGPTPRPERP